MSVQTQFSAAIALGFIFSAGLPAFNAQAACMPADCAALGYNVNDTSKCIGNILRCPFDKTKAYCQTNTCGEKFFGLTECPPNANCSPCAAGGTSYQKTITCKSGYVFDTADWQCKSDSCPTGYARTARDCGTSGSSGWTLSSYSDTASEAGNPCYRCSKNSCDVSYNLTYCTSGCNSCYEGDTAKYKCPESYGKTMYNSMCLYILIKNNIWQGNFPSACCFYKDPSQGIYSKACSALNGESAYRYPLSKAEISCGTTYKNGYDVYYKY